VRLPLSAVRADAAASETPAYSDGLRPSWNLSEPGRQGRRSIDAMTTICYNNRASQTQQRASLSVCGGYAAAFTSGLASTKHDAQNAAALRFGGKADGVKQEEWRAILGFPAYEVSDEGRVRSFWVPRRRAILSAKPRILKLSRLRGYYRVCLWRERKDYYFRVNRLVLVAFVGSPREAEEAMHLDDDKSNNRLDNLAWGSRQENLAALARRGFPQGEMVKHHKLTVAEVISIRARASTSSRTALAREYRVGKATINDVVWRKTWTHI